MSNRSKPIVTSQVVTITPTEAARLMRNAANIRKPRKRLAEQYAAEMRAGRWHMNGESIKLDPNGRVIDGQHRLLACIEADMPFQTLLVTGVTALGVDEGASRSFGDLLGGLGLTSKALAGAVVRVLYHLSRGEDPWLDAGRISNETLMDYFESLDQKRFAWAMETAVLNQRPIPGSSVGALCYQAGASPEAQELIADFFTGMSKMVGLPADGPQVLLLRWAEKARNSKKAGVHWRRAYYVAAGRAWNAFANGAPFGRTSIWNRIHDAALPKVVSQ